MKGGVGDIWYPPHRERSRVEDQALPFRTRHDLCRQEVAPEGSQKIRAQGPAQARRCGTKGRTRPQGRGREREAGTGTRIEMRVGVRESLGTYEVVIEVGRKTREGGRRQRVTSNRSRKTRRPSETVVSCEGLEPRDGRRGTGSGRTEER